MLLSNSSLITPVQPVAMQLLALIVIGALSSPSVELRVLAASPLSAIVRVGELGLSLDSLLEGLSRLILEALLEEVVRGGNVVP